MRKEKIVYLILTILFTLTAGAAASVEDMILENMVIESPPQLFAMMTLINMTGYDRDNFEGYGTIRQAVRDSVAVRQAVVESGIPEDWWTNITGPLYDVHWANIYRVPPRLSGPPSFEFIVKDQVKEEVNKLYEINGTLALMWDAGLKDIYEKYKDQIEEGIERLKTEGYEKLIVLAKRISLSESEIKEFIVYYNVLDSRAFGLAIDDTELGLNILSSAPLVDNSPNVLNLLHEFSHTFIKPTFAVSPEVARLAQVLQEQYGPPKSQEFYDSWTKVIDDSFARALSRWAFHGNSLRGKVEVSRQTTEGFIMADYIYDVLVSEKEFESGADFVQSVVRSYISHLTGITVPEGFYNNAPIVKLPPGEDITLNLGLPIDSESLQGIKIVAEASGLQTPIDVTLQSDGKTIAVFPATAFRPGSLYHLCIPDLLSKSGDTIPMDAAFSFRVPE